MVTTPSPLASICVNMPTTAVSILRKVSVSILISISASHTAVSHISGSISSMISSAVGGGGGGGGGGMDGSTHGLKYDAFTLYLCPLNSDFGLICLSKNLGSLSPSLTSHRSTSCATSPTARTTPLPVLTSLIISTLERIAGIAGEPWPESPISPGIQRGESSAATIAKTATPDESCRASGLGPASDLAAASGVNGRSSAGWTRVRSPGSVPRL